MNKKVTYLPHVKERLQNKFAHMTRLMTDGNVEKALTYIEVLLKHEYETERLYVKKLYCLHELGCWQAIEQLAESLRTEKINPQIDLYYVVSLFKQEQYELVIDFFHESINAEQVPENIYKEMKHVYDESKHIINEKANTINEQIQLAIVSGNGRDQWLLFHQWDKLNIKPPELFLYMLQEKRVNPIVKTNILKALQQWQVTEEVIVSKAEKSQTFSLNELSDLMNHPVYEATLKRIESIEQSNPTLHVLVWELLQRYAEFIYPFLYEAEDIEFVSEAAIALARNHLEGTHIANQNLSHKTINFIKQIEHSNEAYFQLMMT